MKRFAAPWAFWLLCFARTAVAQSAGGMPGNVLLAFSVDGK
jgi:hypothetical protein